MKSTRLTLGILLLVAMSSAGCATAPPANEKTSPLPTGPTATATPTPAPMSAPAPASPMPGTQVGTTASGGVIMSGNRPTVPDSMPTADAKAVLESIPEPLPADQRVPPRQGSGAAAVTGVAALGDSTVADSLRVGDDGDVPVPAPSEPIGDKPGSVSGGAAAPPPPPPPPSGAATAAAECWRVQFAAVPEADRGERLKGAAESQLSVPCVVEKEKTLYKVRTRDCQGSAAADETRKRAIGVGFTGAFKIRDAKK